MIPIRKAYLGLNHLKFSGLVFLDLAPAGFDPSLLLAASREALAAQGWIGPRNASRLVKARESLDVDALERALEDARIGYVTPADEEYPADLARISCPPLVLYTRGRKPQGKPWIGVVGTRRATPYGLEMADKLSRGLAAAGAVVVSGLATGIDTAAHVAALAATRPSLAATRPAPPDAQAALTTEQRLEPMAGPRAASPVCLPAFVPVPVSVPVPACPSSLVRADAQEPVAVGPGAPEPGDGSQRQCRTRRGEGPGDGAAAHRMVREPGHAQAQRLSAGGTVAVLGCGVDQIYPPRNATLQKRIEREGWLVSEMPPGTSPHPHHFPRRNRIIAGMCAGVVVVEAPERSGARITARMATDEGREVFAVPGPATSHVCAGSNALIKQGAALVTGAQDVLGHYGIRADATGAPSVALSLSDGARGVLHALRVEGSSADELAGHLGLDYPLLYDLLLELVGQGAAVRQPGGRFAPTEQGLANGSTHS